ncbi:sigma 54-interacting transcriptional regulator [Tundrisphaera lichenicola]|uniref:sigma 54-interacting transcriptional regulator n=1 Tax=Tundrisphaera lichenicola TaxID=2029860 RepID=UPI003EB69E24
MPPSRASAFRLDVLVQQASEPIFWLGPDRRILQVNRAWEELTGHRAEDVVGLECNAHGPSRSGELVGLAGSFSPPPEALSGRPSSTETLIFQAGGGRLWRRIAFWPFHDEQGGIGAILGLIHPPDEPALAPESQAHKLRCELLRLRERLIARHGSDILIGHGPEHQRLLHQVAAASMTDVPVLIVGEPGTGKLLTARSIHQRGSRRQAPMPVYDCKALPPEILDRELFGPASNDPARSLIAPEGSTILIGDILDLPRDIQARLASTIDGPVRLIATTTGDPDAGFRSERLRPDFYYLISSLIIRIRPLRERLDELPLLAQHLLERANLRGNHQRVGFSPAALDALLAYDWPGNLRELSRVIDEAHNRGHSEMIQLDDIPPGIRGHRGGAYNPPPPGDPVSLKDMLANYERRLIERALDRSGKNKSRAAKLLGINRPLLYRRIKELGIPDEFATESDADKNGAAQEGEGAES